ncbi:hypothetical protein PG994_004238 [Apiospora phragmitis]|uniref:BZIP domain-containing protein n=1 Tax=Apiospora phragmitis TaxID=2905665 RepID=A0ABR1VTW5_9PEZI
MVYVVQLTEHEHIKCQRPPTVFEGPQVALLSSLRTNSDFRPVMDKEEDYRNVQDPKERRRIQNRVNQRRNREKTKRTRKEQVTEQATETATGLASVPVNIADSVTVAPMAHDDDLRPPKRPCYERPGTTGPPPSAPFGQTNFLDIEQTRAAYRELPFGSVDQPSAPGHLTDAMTGSYEQGGTAPAVSAVPASAGNPPHIVTRAGDGLSTPSFLHSATWTESDQFGFPGGVSAGSLDVHTMEPWPILSTMPAYEDANQLAADPEELTYWLKEFDPVEVEKDAELRVPEEWKMAQAQTRGSPNDGDGAGCHMPASDAALRRCFERIY